MIRCCTSLLLLMGTSWGHQCKKHTSKLSDASRRKTDPAFIRTALPTLNFTTKFDINHEIKPESKSDTKAIFKPDIKPEIKIEIKQNNTEVTNNQAPIIYQYNYQINYNFPSHFSEEIINYLNKTLLDNTRYVIREANPGNFTHQTIKLPESKTDNKLPIPSKSQPRILFELVPSLDPRQEPELMRKPGLASPELISEIDYYVKFAGASYCDKKCSYCKKMDFDVELIRLVNKTTNINALVAVLPRKQEIVVSYRGSDGPVKFLGSAFAFQTPFAWVKGGYVHENVFYYMNSIHSDVIKTLVPLFKKYPGYRLLLTGHSLGGALATLSAPFISRDMKIPYSQMRIITYGQIRVGNLPFAMWYNHLNINFTRVVNGIDGIADFPSFSNDWVHIQQEVYIKNGDYFVCSTTKMEHPHCSFKKLSFFGLMGSHQRVNNQSLNPLRC